MTYHSSCWMAFMVDGKVTPVYIDWSSDFEKTKAKYGEPVPLVRHDPERDWKTKEGCNEEIDRYLFEQYFQTMFRENYAEPLIAAIEANGKEINSGQKLFIGDRRGEITLHNFARIAWQEGLLLEVKLVPKEEL